MNSKRFGYIIIIAVLSTFLVIGLATQELSHHILLHAVAVNHHHHQQQQQYPLSR